MPQHRDPTVWSKFRVLRGHTPLRKASRPSQNCKRLQNLAFVLGVRKRCAPSWLLLRLHVGHSNVNDPLHTTILLNYFAPLLESQTWAPINVSLEKQKPTKLRDANRFRVLARWRSGRAQLFLKLNSINGSPILIPACLIRPSPDACD
jgi:hypothetical protein